MKSWASSESDVLCGYCGTLVKSGTRFGLLEGAGMRRKTRCASCFKAYGPPEDTGEAAGPEVLLVPHGGAHNDTIAVVERKQRHDEA